MIDSFQGKYRFLSNFWPVQIELDGCRYPSVEHAYQAAKTIIPESRKRFINPQLTAGAAKKLGRSLTIRKDWEKVKLAIMEGFLRQKFLEKPELKRMLLATEPHELVEGNTWGDIFWGKHEGKGFNHLGQLLMKIRKEICENGSN